jgi:nicotinate-nucleotide adenylyltransferase
VNSQRIGVLGGTFDPIHIGHLVTGANVRHALHLDLVLFVVANDPWQKADRDVSPAPERLAMVTAAVDGHTGLAASGIEIERGGVSYTADTLRTLHEHHPDAELFLIIGQDQATNLHTWKRVQEIRSLASLVVVRRPGSSGGLPADVTVVDVPLLEVSSSDVRARFADGRPLDWLVPDAAVRLAREHGLYRPA